jgi:ubiquitin-associated SH3 domain-containing protein
MTTAELILYATPVGPLAAALDDLFERINDTQPTTAQTYPPHCTLTGFFHRSTSEIPRITSELAAAAGRLEPMPADAVEIVELHRRPDWVGLELRSSWLEALTEGFVREHELAVGDDALRPKSWPHLSIAYGDVDLAHAIESVVDFDIDLPVSWEVDLWQRAGRSWKRLGDRDDQRP